MRVSLFALLLALLGACKTPASGPYASQESGKRQTAEAERLTQAAAAIVDAEPEKAQSMLRKALERDLFFGPAHNNLGVVHLKRGELYEAAGEFEWARKLMPGHPDPRVNLALTLERAGRSGEAIATYSAALEVYPDYLPAIQGLASLTLKSGSDDERMQGWLEAIAMRCKDAKWREWAHVIWLSGR
jgi:Tfp pilus assembly protein PilF